MQTMDTSFDIMETPTLIVKASSVVSIQLDGDMYKLVAFRPSRKTLVDVKAAVNSIVSVQIEDVSGTFTRQTPMFITDIDFSEATRTLVIDLENAE